MKTLSPISRFCSFYLSESLYGVNIRHVKEINRGVEFTPIAHAPGEVEGYVNIRGQIHLILNLRRMLGLEDSGRESANTVVLFKPAVGESFGILVDRIGDVVEVPDTAIEETSLSEGAQDEERILTVRLISGLCKLKSGILLIIDASKLLKIVESQIESR